MRHALAILATCTSIGFVAACGGDKARSEPSPSEAAGAQTNARTTASPLVSRSGRPRPAVKVMSSRYGEMLFDRRGRALYLFTRENGRRPRCYGGCAAAWPPFVVSRTPVAERGVKASLLGTTRRRDGKRQVTYRGHPLYYYVGDRRPGQVLCQAVEEFGGFWYVVSPSGAAIR